MWKLIGLLVSVDQLVLFFPDVYRFPDPPFHVCFFLYRLELKLVLSYEPIERD